MINTFDPQLAQLRQRELLEKAERHNQHRQKQPNPLTERLQTAFDSVRTRVVTEQAEQERATLPWSAKRA